MTCPRCAGLIVCDGNEQRCVNCGNRLQPLRPHEVKEMHEPERIVIAEAVHG